MQKSALSLKDFISHVFPKSFFESMSNNEILQIVVFALFLALPQHQLARWARSL
nr:cation:dicarboxylase symporter family transporter [Mucilaginibacter humi]